jgi:hypothetical protein
MQDGSVIRRNRKKHSDIWQFRWWEKTADGKKIYRRRQIGTVDEIPDLETARKAARLLVPDLNARTANSKPVSMTVALLCSHFEQCELSLANTWRSYSTKTVYKVYLKRWLIPKWNEHLLSDIRTIEVESWLRSLPIARSTCAKIRNVMSVLFNHACRYEFFDGNPIRLVRQSAKRRSPPVVLTAGEIRILLEGLKIPISLRHELGGLWVCRFYLFGRLLKHIRQSRVPAVRAGERPVLAWNDPLNIFRNQRKHTLSIAAASCCKEIFHNLNVVFDAHGNLSLSFGSSASDLIGRFGTILLRPNQTVVDRSLLLLE